MKDSWHISSVFAEVREREGESGQEFWNSKCKRFLGNSVVIKLMHCGRTQNGKAELSTKYSPLNHVLC